MSYLKLIQSEVCPFAQRSHMCMLEKSLDFEIIEINLENKPIWFKEISPYSKVPVLRNGETTLYESTIINEYLDEAYPAPALMPESYSDRARARIWIDYDNVKFVPDFYRVLMEQDLESQQVIADRIAQHLRFFEFEGLTSSWKGPYWFDDFFSLVDIALYPHFERLSVLETYRKIGIPANCPRLTEWLSAVRERSSAVATAHNDNYHIHAYRHYVNDTAGTTAKDIQM